MISAQVQPIAPRLRIMLAPSAYYPHVGGIEELTRQLARTFQGQGHEVSVLTNRWPEGASRDEVLDGVRVTRLRFPLPAGNPRALLRFAVAAPSAAIAVVRHIRRVRPDVVHVIGAGPQGVYVGVLAGFVRAPVVFTAQGELTFDPQNVFQHSLVMRLGLRRLLRTAAAVTACSSFVAKSLERLTDVSRVQVIPNGVNPSDFSDIVPTGMRDTILALGRLARQKGFDVLLDAMTDESLAAVKLIIAGDGPERSALEAQARRLGIDARVRFVGTAGRSEMGKLMADAGVFVFPSRGEPFGIALLEAMACGTPSVATAAGGVLEFAVQGHNTKLVEAEDPKALAEATASLLRDDDLRLRLREGGIATAAELAWTRLSPRYEATYRGVLRSTADGIAADGVRR